MSFFSEASQQFEILNRSILLATLTLVSFSAIHNTGNNWNFSALLMQLEIIIAKVYRHLNSTYIILRENITRKCI